MRFASIPVPSTFTILLLLYLSGSISGCATQTTEEEAQPQAQSIRLRDPQKAPLGPVTTLDQTIKKDLFNVRLSPKGIYVNDTKIKDIAALEAFLKKYSKPVITISTHRCYSSEQAAQVMNLARLHTDTPIVYGSFGDFSDPECQ